MLHACCSPALLFLFMPVQLLSLLLILTGSYTLQPNSAGMCALAINLLAFYPYSLSLTPKFHPSTITAFFKLSCAPMPLLAWRWRWRRARGALHSPPFSSLCPYLFYLPSSPPSSLLPLVRHICYAGSEDGHLLPNLITLSIPSCWHLWHFGTSGRDGLNNGATVNARPP